MNPIAAARSRIFVGLFCLLLSVCVASDARGNEIWVVPTLQTDTGGLGVGNGIWPVSPQGVTRLVVAVPDDLQTFQGAKIVLIPSAPAGAGVLHVHICTAENSDMVGASCSGPVNQPFTGIVNRLIEVDVTAALAPHVSDPGARYLAIAAYTTPTFTTDHITGLRFAYAPTAPAGVATLGANTFTGTQSAPTFAGDGSGLTNVSANLLDGIDSTAFALAAHGHDVSQVTNAARLSGGNTFTGTQTIDAGNLDLDNSTATAGNITKNGLPFLHSFGSENTFLGKNAGNLSMTGIQNSGFGLGALGANTTGHYNTAAGYYGLFSNTTGTYNTALGVQGLWSNTTGAWNTANGAFALNFNTTGDFNTASGDQALLSNTTGSSNTAVGHHAGAEGTTGSNNIYLGANVFGLPGESDTMYLGKIGTQTKTVIAGVRGTLVAGGEIVVIDANGRLGSAAAGAPGANSVGTNEVINDSLTSDDLAPNSVGLSEVAFNYAASASEGGVATNSDLLDGIDSTGFALAAHGHDVTQVTNAARLTANTFTATQTIDTGNLDLDASTSTAGNITKGGQRFLHNFGSGSTFLGATAGNFTMTGNQNTGIGALTLSANTTGSGNTVIGNQAMSSNTTGSDNTAVGERALLINLEGFLNTANGAQALRDNTGSSNTASGALALRLNTTGTGNTAVGSNSLANITTGHDNVAVGNGTGFSSTTGSANIYLGAGISGVAGETHTMYLGRVGLQTTTFIAGVRGATTGVADAIPVVIDSNGELGTISSSRRFKEDIHPMAQVSRRLFQLRPVTFRYTNAYSDGSKPIQYGLVAEEVADVFPELAVRSADGTVETVHYETLNVLLLNELQQQEKRIQALEQKLNDLLSKVQDAR